MDLWKSALLGLVQGLTEFLPVSSSGHLVLIEHFLHYNAEENLPLVVVLHAGTLLATLMVYGGTVKNLLRYLFAEMPRRWKQEGFRAALWTDEQGRLISLIIIGCIPTALIGFFFKDTFEELFGSIRTTSIALAITGILLYTTKGIPQRLRGTRRNGVWSAFIVGTVQGLAITPGISRSGSTISAGMWTGLDRRAAADYSFLLSMPAILGAIFLTLKDISAVPAGGVLGLLVGFVVSGASGYVALRVLLGFVRRGKLHVFAWYCWVVAAIGLYSSFS